MNDGLPHIRTAIPGPRSLELAARLAVSESPDTTFLSAEFPVFWESAEGANVTDVDGNVYLDLTAAFGVAAVGHSHPRVVAAVREQAGRLIHGMGDVHPTELKVRLAEEVIRRAPGGAGAGTVAGGSAGPSAGGGARVEWRVIFGGSGSEAVEAALKTAALATGRAGVIAFEDAYHGLTIGTLGATAWPKFRRGLEGLVAGGGAGTDARADADRMGGGGGNVTRFPYPSAEVDGSGEAVLEWVGRFLEGSAGMDEMDGMDRMDRMDEADGSAESVHGVHAVHTVHTVHAAPSPSPPGAILIEPILGRGGVVIPPAGFLSGLRRLCDEHGLLLILDEVYTGFCRTGRMFACEHEGVIPDLIAAGKALGGGMPISVCIGRRDVIEAWGKSTGEARHTSTFLGHPLACAGALAALEVMEEERLAEAAANKGERLLDLLKAGLAGRGCVGSIRGLGMMIGIVIVDAATGEPDGARAWRIVVAGLRRGLILLPCGRAGNVISITPPIILNESQMMEAARILVEIIGP